MIMDFIDSCSVKNKENLKGLEEKCIIIQEIANTNGLNINDRTRVIKGIFWQIQGVIRFDLDSSVKRGYT